MEAERRKGGLHKTQKSLSRIAEKDLATTLRREENANCNHRSCAMEGEEEQAAFPGEGCWGIPIIRGLAGFSQGQEMEKCLVKKTRVVGNRSYSKMERVRRK